MKKVKALILAGVMVLSVLALAGCGKECSVCGESSSDYSEVGGVVVCSECQANPLRALQK